MPSALSANLGRLAESLASSDVKLPLPLKLRTAEIILRLMGRRKSFGLFVILGWSAKWSDYLDRPDSEQDLFAAHRLNIMNLRQGAKAARDLAATVNFDGAILIDRRGNIVHSGVLIEGMRPRLVAQAVNPGRFADLSEQFGFETKVHTRHLTAIASSRVFRGTTVFTVSEENGAFHVYENGKIAYRS